MLSKQEQNQVKETGGFLLEPSPQHYSIVNALAQGAGRIGASVRDTFHSAIASWELWTTRTVLSSALEKKELAPVTLNTSKTHFQVNEAMMPALNCLGIDAVTGEYILFSALKSAYRTSRLRTHPDRAHGNHDEFILIQSAYEELTDLIEAASDSFEMSAELKKYFSDLDDKIDEVKSVYQDLRSDMDGLNQRVDGFVQRADEHTQRVAAHCEQHAKDMHELTNKMSILKATLKANGYDLDAEENNDSNDENKASSSQASNPHRLFTPSTVNSGSSSSNDRLNSDDLANANK